jgi:hypothetical protein
MQVRFNNTAASKNVKWWMISNWMSVASDSTKWEFVTDEYLKSRFKDTYAVYCKKNKANNREETDGNKPARTPGTPTVAAEHHHRYGGAHAPDDEQS